MGAKLKYLILSIISTTLIATARAGPPDTIDFFPNIKDNLTRLTWAHAVNDAQYLEEVLRSPTMMIEADVVMGTLIDDPSGVSQPVMGHPPATTSDISLQQFLSRINESNNDIQRSVKGVKLDFKSIEVFEASIETIDRLYNEVQYPVWINADILRGTGSLATPVDPGRFLQGNVPYPDAMLSIGWTTRSGAIFRNDTYTDEQIGEMLDTIMSNDVKQKLTFPVRAAHAARSLDQLQRLLSESGSNSTLTIFSSTGDVVDIEKLRILILTCGLNRVYLDVPKDIMDQLHL